ncbi:MAG TPA: hypothetical protein VH299_06010 [Solirubrobacterales bacterium]|jgi:hypothetical protein|nr:hypothetical protein [Solirubrobacterales bacterium]
MQLRTVGACALVLCVSLAVAASASATTATLRVVGTGNKVLAEQLVKTSNISVKTSPKATCFGSGTGGSGKPVALKGNTALGLLADGAKTIKALAPLTITDHFSFGLGLCGVGKSTVKGKASWYLKINHKGATVGGEKAKIKAGDEVLWDLASSYPYPEELVVSAPTQTTAGVPFAVHVYAYNEKGKRKPVQGAAVTGAIGPTDKNGKVMITLTEPTKLIAGLGDDIPSAAVPVCLGSKCPAAS